MPSFDIQSDSTVGKIVSQSLNKIGPIFLPKVIFISPYFRLNVTLIVSWHPPHFLPDKKQKLVLETLTISHTDHALETCLV